MSVSIIERISLGIAYKKLNADEYILNVCIYLFRETTPKNEEKTTHTKTTTQHVKCEEYIN